LLKNDAVIQPAGHGADYWFSEAMQWWCSLFMPLPAISHRRHCVFRLSVCLCVSVILPTRYLTSWSWEFRQTYNTGAVGIKINWWDFEVKGRGHDKTRVHVSNLRAIFSPVSGMRRRIVMKLVTITRYQVHMTLKKVPSSEFRVNKPTFLAESYQ